jgi:phage gpG-like protein
MIRLEEQGFKDAEAALKAAAQKGANLRPVLQRFGRYMKDISIPQNFRARGRPISWKPVRRFGQSGVDPLRDQGYLLNSVGFRVEGNDLVLGAGNKSNLRYAKKQQEGGFILPKKKYLAIPCVPPLSMSEARTTWAKDWKGKGTWIMRGPEGFGVYRKSKVQIGAILGGKKGPKAIYAKGSKGVEMIFRLVPKVFIRARPFLLFQKEDVAWFAKAAFAYIFSADQADVKASGG